LFLPVYGGKFVSFFILLPALLRDLLCQRRPPVEKIHLS
jgi:hypothetical protein